MNDLGDGLRDVTSGLPGHFQALSGLLILSQALPHEGPIPQQVRNRPHVPGYSPDTL